MRAPKILLILAGLAGGVATSPATPYAMEIVSARGPFGPSQYGDTNAVLGAPATWFYDPFGGTNRRVKLVEAAYNVAADTNGLLTPNLITTLGNGSRIIARFDQPVQDHPANPYGIDFLVFGNAFYSPSGFVNDSTDMNTATLAGGLFSEAIKVSVSPGYTGQPSESPDDPDTWQWYRYDDGPYADSDFPTHAFKWDRAATNWTDDLMDFTKPVNPALKALLRAGRITVADAIDLYAGSGGGTGFDLQASGFDSIQYVKVEGISPGFSGGEIDAFSIVRPTIVGDELSVAPENVTNGTATLLFQQPDAPGNNVVTLHFTQLDGVAKVSTAPLNDLSAYAPLPGAARTAVQLQIAPILGSTAATFTAALSLTAGTNYSGDGSDLLILKSTGTNWNSVPFSHQTTNHHVLVSGVTNVSAFVVAQFVAPALQLSPNDKNHDITFTPVVALLHTLERSTNLVDWSEIGSFIASNALPVVLTDNAAPDDNAYYRVRLNQP